MGQELYRLFWLDFFLEVAEVMILDFVRGLIVRYQLMCTLSDWVSCIGSIYLRCWASAVDEVNADQVVCV